MQITIHPPTSIPGCPDHSKLVAVEVDGDEASVRVWPDRGWQLLRASGEADKITDWTFVADTLINGAI